VELSDEHRAKLKAVGQQAGEPGRNPTGRNGWTAMRERYQLALDDRLDKITDTLLELAENGDTQAIGLALKPLLNVSLHELSGPDGSPINFIELAKKAQEEAKDD